MNYELQSIYYADVTSPKRLGQRVASVPEILRNAGNTSPTRSSNALNASNALTNTDKRHRSETNFCACIKTFYLTNVHSLAYADKHSERIKITFITHYERVGRSMRTFNAFN